MKKIIAVFSAIILLTQLSACTVQNEINADILSQRICQSKQFTTDSQILFRGKTGYSFFTSVSGNKFLLRFNAIDNTLQKISGAAITLHSEDEISATQKNEFITLCKLLTDIFSTDDSTEITQKLNIPQSDFINDDFNFYETKDFRYSFIKTKIGADFFVESKKEVPDSSVIQSLSQTQPLRIS